MSKWYNLIASIYDHFSKRTYQIPRKVLVDKLGLQQGDSVFLVGCGTGLIFHLIQDKIGEAGILVGLDFSKNMLAQAFDHAIGELSFSVMPEWKSVMRKSLNLVKEDGRFGVLDGHRPKRDWLNAVLNFFPQSDISRPISNYLSDHTENYTFETFGHTKIVFVGVGQKMVD